eukprot:768317-Hanusia_phi.AAC.12
MSDCAGNACGKTAAAIVCHQKMLQSGIDSSPNSHVKVQTFERIKNAVSFSSQQAEFAPDFTCHLSIHLLPLILSFSPAAHSLVTHPFSSCFALLPHTPRLPFPIAWHGRSR